MDAVSMKARWRRGRALRSVSLLQATRRAVGTDPLTGAVVYMLAERPAVHWSGAFHAYPWGMPDVPRA